jgi:hypothetical protein
MQECNLNQVLANLSKEEEIFLLTTQEIVEAQKADDKLKHCFKHNMVLDKGQEVSLVNNTHMVCKDDRMIIPKPLQRGTVLWFHHYLQHPGLTCLEETMNATMYCMRSSIRSTIKSCKSCQVNKKQRLKYGHLPPKPIIIITIPWRTLCVDLIGPYTLKGKDGTVIDFMALTMINPASSWFKIVEVLLVRQLKTIAINGKESSIFEEIFDKILDCIARLINTTWLSRYPQCHYLTW